MMKGRWLKVKKMYWFLMLGVSLLLFSGCALLDEILVDENEGSTEVTALEDVVHTENFRDGALEHILEGEVNRKGQAVGFHYDRLPTKKGEIIDGTKTDQDEQGIYEAEVTVEGIEKQSNRGRSTFFPDDWDTQEIVDAINEAYEHKTFINGNTYEGLTDEGIVIRMYLDQKDKIISAFPVYEG